MQHLGPFPVKPNLAIGVSGGADSMALSLLTKGWITERKGRLQALIIDHHLRPDSAAEACVTKQRLEQRGIAARVISLTGLGNFRLQETARFARYAALNAATRDSGALYLLLG